ncbi:MAG: alpha-2-macroglobulin family protein [Pseudomonadota bacterium]
MIIVRLFSIIFSVLIGFPLVLVAQQSVPTERFLLTRDIDFYGSDLTNLFDTTQDACFRACRAQENCVAFTFNTLSNACFPKSAVREQRPFVGAVSARKVLTDPQVIANQDARAADLSFLQRRDIVLARDFVNQNARRYFMGDETLAEVVQSAADNARSNSMSSALFWAGVAVALDDGPEHWLNYARYALRAGEEGRRSERRRNNENALKASINAYLRAADDQTREAALVLMADALEQTGQGRRAISALRAAAAILPSLELVEKIDTAIGKYGFRVVDQRVDSDAAAPRICAEFSEDLAASSMDYEPFVRMDGQGFAVAVQDAQLCIDGVEHGQRYTITLREGLPAASGETLHKDVRLNLYVRDRRQSVRFPGRAYVLPRSATAALPVETVNADTLQLKLQRVTERNLVAAIREGYFGRPLSAFDEANFTSKLAQEVWVGEGRVEKALNADVLTRLPMGDIVVDQQPGIYALSASIPGQDPFDFPAAMQWFVLSDLGISTMSGIDGMHIAVRALGDVSARADVALTLISRANDVLGTERTDAMGFAQFSAGLIRGEGSASPALLIAEDENGDVAFLPLTDPAFDLSDRGVEGNPPAPPIDTFLTTDRGAYRVGETVYATALTRDRQAQAIEGVPITAILRRPDGVEYTRQLSANAQAGGHVFALRLGSDVPRGAWRLDLYADLEATPLASQRVLVEDFLPERIDFDMTLAEEMLEFSTTPELQVNARYLFGSPAANLPIEGSLTVSETRSLPGWAGYQFGRHDLGFTNRTSIIGDTTTDEAGDAVLLLQMPRAQDDPGALLMADITVQVSENSGRPVERSFTAPIKPTGSVIGIKPLFSDVLSEGETARFDLIAVTSEGQADALPVRWTLNRLQNRSQWYSLGGRWRWETTTQRIRVATDMAQLGQEPVTISAPTEWGEYELVVEHLGPKRIAASTLFYVDWYGDSGDGDTPDRLAMSLNKDVFSVGDTVELRMVPEREGVALVSVLSNKLIERQTVPVKAGENRISLTVSEDWGTGAYVTASVVHPMVEGMGQNPSRSLGVAHASVNSDTKELQVKFDVPERIDGQAGILKTRISLDGIAPGEDAFVTLAAVDVGILNLTGFQAPDAMGHYFGQRRLGVELRDIYGRLIDGLNGRMGQIRSGGDASAPDVARALPPTEALMTFFAGPFQVDENGTVEVEMAKPAFNGTIRLMAVAWSATAVGDAAQDVIMRDPVVVSASLPRFLAPGDQSELLIEIVHAEGPAGDMGLSLSSDPAIILPAMPTRVSLAPKGTRQLAVPITATAIGDHQITLVLTTPDGKKLRKELALGVRDNSALVSVTRQFSLGVGERFTFDENVFAGFRVGTAEATLTAGPLARFDLPGLLRQLDRYPYSCTEQLTSNALPLLYLSDLAEQSGLGSPEVLKQRVEDDIARILTRQSSSGGFGLWRAGSSEFWLDAYVTDFLARARSEGYDVSDRAFSMAMDNLQNRVNYAPDFDRGGEALTYALFVLAREGVANIGDLRYYADVKSESLATPLAAAHLAAALSLYGDQDRASQLFARASVMFVWAADDRRDWNDDFGSKLRDTAAVLALAAEVGTTAVDAAALLASLRSTDRLLSTQESAHIALAAHAFSETGPLNGILVDGIAATGQVVQQLDDQSSGASIIENVGQIPTDVTMTAYGVPEIAPPADGYGYKIERRYFTLQGEPAPVSVNSGDRFVAVLEITPFKKIGARLMINDPLPAGFEIDNPNLVESGQIDALDWLVTKSAQHVEFRSDRFLAAVDHRDEKPFRLAYVVRAVTPGTYSHPAATVEDMYRPEYRANTAQGTLVVRK